MAYTIYNDLIIFFLIILIILIAVLGSILIIQIKKSMALNNKDQVIKKSSVKKDDVLVIKCPNDMLTYEESIRLKNELNKILDCHVIVIPCVLDLHLVSKELMNEYGWYKKEEDN